jgi:hypothetical protein
MKVITGLAVGVVLGLGVSGSAEAAPIYATDFQGYTNGTVQGQDDWTSFNATSQMYVEADDQGKKGMYFHTLPDSDKAAPYAWRPFSGVPDNSQVTVEFDVRLSDFSAYSEIWCIGRDGTGGQYPSSFSIFIAGNNATNYQVGTYQDGGSFYSITKGNVMPIATTAHINIAADYGTHTYAVNVQDGSSSWTKSGLSWADTTGDNGSTDALRGLYYSGLGGQAITVDNIVVNVVPEPASLLLLLALGGLLPGRRNAAKKRA